MQGLPAILVVEDDQSIQGIVEEALTEGGFDAAISATGEEALTLLKGQVGHYRALVTDINLLASTAGRSPARHDRSTLRFRLST
jgi:DNA-binding response OmpR family regulator